MEKLFTTKQGLSEMVKKAVSDIRSSIAWGQATDELDYYLGTSVDYWADKISKSFDLEYSYVSDSLYKEVRKYERI